MKTIVISWNGRPKVVSRDKLETAWLVWQDFLSKEEPELVQLQAVRNQLLNHYDFDNGEAIEFAVAARHWKPEE
jgi:hypothetical protein